MVYRIRQGRSEFLLVQNRKNGIWSFPKGGAAKGETLEEAAWRELKEETRLKPKQLEVHADQFTESYPFKGGTRQVTYYLARCLEPDSIRIRVEELMDWGWFSVEEGLKLLQLADRRKLLKIAGERVEAIESR